jgi:UDP-N-acetylglucosamine--N-acetylmuramyl-(pentapeptide) pyrophosphoryl-undecaprenol N-acetylglucosamine transferase
MNSELKNEAKIIFTGGGTGGSVAPLLAIAETLRETGDFDFLWLGTKKGPEKVMVEKENIVFKAIISGKLRRYFSWQNFTDIIRIKIGFFQSIFIISKFRPDLILTVGSFVSVPVAWAGWLCRVPVMIHQQDVRPGLANKLMSPAAKTITVTFEKSLADYGNKAAWIGNPVRINFRSKISDFKFDGFSIGFPTILVLGGGTGATAINELVGRSINELTQFCNVIHVTGENKKISNHKSQIRNYLVEEFFSVDKMASAMKAACIVISRAGMSTLTELSFLGKPSILIPIPDSHQEDNAKLFEDAKAAIVLSQKELDKDRFVSSARGLLDDKDKQTSLSANIKKVIKTGANEEMVRIVKDLI